MKYGRIVREVCATPWAITPERMADIVDVLAFHAGGGKLTPEEIRAYVDQPEAAAGRADSGGGVAILPLKGIISHRIESVRDISGPGGTSTEGFTRQFRQALNDSSVGSIVMDVNSPGGSVAGVDELASEIRESRGSKPIVAVANAQAGSAAYYIASAADELVVTPSGQIGSIGVFSAHENMQKALERLGVEHTLISAGKYKVEGNPFEPLSDEAREAIQAKVDAYYDAFVNAVAAGRGVSAATVRNGFGQGRMALAEDAVAEGMADSIETLDQVVQRMAGRGQNTAGVSARSRRLAFI